MPRPGALRELPLMLGFAQLSHHIGDRADGALLNRGQRLGQGRPDKGNTVGKKEIGGLGGGQRAGATLFQVLGQGGVRRKKARLQVQQGQGDLLATLAGG